MKSVLRGGVLYVVAAIVLIGVAVWYISSDSGSDEVARGRELRARKVVAQNDAKKAARRQKTQRVRKERLGNKVKESKPAVKPNFLSDIGEEEKLTAEMKQLFLDIQNALDREDRKSVFALVRKLQQMDEWPDGIPRSVKMKALNALAWFGASGMAEAVGFLADSDPEVQQTTFEKFDAMLSDSWEDGDYELAKILTTIAQMNIARFDSGELSEFYNSIYTSSFMNMRDIVKAQTVLDILNTGSPKAVEVIKQNWDVLLDADANTDGSQTIIEQVTKILEDAQQEYRDNPDKKSDDDVMYGPWDW